jgi:hypothetical protein
VAEGDAVEQALNVTSDAVGRHDKRCVWKNREIRRAKIGLWDANPGHLQVGYVVNSRTHLQGGRAYSGPKSESCMTHDALA